jgi:pimeloyl-ACP methyl ester carboxylesterase
VSQLLATAPRDYRSFVFLSPVFLDETGRTLTFAPNEPSPTVLVVTGRLDDRVPLSYVENAARELKRAGAEVRLDAIDDANHFLVFSHREQVMRLLAAWLSR